MKTLDEYYKESSVKGKTRTKIVLAALKESLSVGIDAMTMQGVAKRAEITPRNLYRYYSNKEFLVIDAAYYFMNLLDTTESFMLEPELSGISQLEKVLKHYYLDTSYAGSTLIQEVDTIEAIKFIHQFDFYLMGISEDSPAFIRYTTLYVENLNTHLKSYLTDALTSGIIDGTIAIKHEEISFYKEFIMQSMRGITIRVLLKKKERSSINMLLVQKNIEMIIQYLGAK